MINLLKFVNSDTKRYICIQQFSETLADSNCLSVTITKTLNPFPNNKFWTPPN